MSYRKSAVPKYTPKPVNTPTPRRIQSPNYFDYGDETVTPPPVGSGTVLGRAAGPLGDFRNEAVLRLQEKYDADAKVAAEKKRLKRLEELERILPTEMEGRILASGEAGGAIYARQQQVSAGGLMPLSLQEKEEQRKKSIRELERKYEKDAKIQAEKQKLAEEKRRSAAIAGSATDEETRRATRLAELRSLVKNGEVLDVKMAPN